jgi:MtN3 and saliva related transmembrane protein
MSISEIIGYLAAFLTTFSFLPQALMTIRTKDTNSLSLAMYSMFTLGVFCWLLYGIYLVDNALILANAITFMFAAIILAFKIYNVITKKE